MGITIGDDKLSTLHYADDQVIFADDEQDIHHMFRKLNARIQQIWTHNKHTEDRVCGCRRLWLKSAIRSRQCEKCKNL
jgi:hypothetical protein